MSAAYVRRLIIQSIFHSALNMSDDSDELFIRSVSKIIRLLLRKRRRKKRPMRDFMQNF